MFYTFLKKLIQQYKYKFNVLTWSHYIGKYDHIGSGLYPLKLP